MRKCPVCSKEVPDDARFCGWCRADLAQAPPAGPAGEPVTSGKALASLILGLFFVVFPAAILAVIFGHWSRAEIRASAGRLKGAGMALAGLILGYVGIAIIPLAIIAAVAIPNLLRAKQSANEAAAVSALRQIHVAAAVYLMDNLAYPPTLEALTSTAGGGTAGASAPNRLDATLASGQKSGYRFTYRAADTRKTGTLDAYTVHADPIVPGTTGLRHFYTDHTGVVRAERDASANEHSPPVR